jgi:hypothetical protein
VAVIAAHVGLVRGARAAYSTTYRSKIAYAVSTGTSAGSTPGFRVVPIASLPFTEGGLSTFGASVYGLLDDGRDRFATSSVEVTSPSSWRRSMWLWDYVGFGVVTLGEEGLGGAGGFLCTRAASSSSRRRVT